MELPPIADGTVTLRPFAKGDAEAAVDWVSGPTSRSRSATDGGPVTDFDGARALVDDLQHSNAYAIEVDDAPQGWASLRTDGKGRGHLQVVLAEPRLWVQGIGGRVVRLVRTVAFDHLDLDAIVAGAVPETAEAARVSFEDAGFGMTRRYLDGNRVLIDFHLDHTSHQASEQRVLLVHHGRTAGEADGRLLGSAIDPPLDAIGRAQAEALTCSGLITGVGECVSSPLKRAAATAEQAFATREVPSTVDSAWSDRDWGDWSGSQASDAPRSDAGHVADPPGGESDSELGRRAMAALDDLPYGRHIAVVTHGAVIATLLRHLRPALAEASGLGSGAGIPHGSITQLHRGPSGWRIIRIGDDRHQQARRATAESA